MTVANHSIDALVREYADLGRAYRHRQFVSRLRRGAVAGGSLLLVGLLVAGLSRIEITSVTVSRKLHDSEQALAAANANLRAARTLNASLAHELRQITERRAELSHQRELLLAQHASLDTELEHLNAAQAELVQRQSQLAAESQRLASEQAALSARRKALGDTRQKVDEEGPKLAAAITELRQQRKTLDEERKRFRAQRRLLEHEIGLLNKQRTALQDQQKRLEDEWVSLQKLMEQASADDTAAPDSDSHARSSALAGPEPAAEPTAATAVDPGGAAPHRAMAASAQPVPGPELGRIRGGFDIGGKLDINIGLTRMVGINGEPEYSSTFNFNGAQAVGYDELAAMPAVVVQNGDGNFIGETASTYAAGLPVVIQNSLDNQHIINANVLDVTISNVASRAATLSAEAAVTDSIALQK